MVIRGEQKGASPDSLSDDPAGFCEPVDRIRAESRLVSPASLEQPSGDRGTSANVSSRRGPSRPGDFGARSVVYQQELARSGELLFRKRGKFLKWVVVIGVVVAYGTASLGPFSSVFLNRLWFGLALSIAVAGAILRMITSGHAAPGTSGNSKQGAAAAELNTTGPYSLVRNPLYLGRILNFTGIAMLSGSWVYGALVFLISVLVYERISVYEEEFLREEFGEAHARWAREVPFLMPRLHGWVKPKYPFWPRRCLMRENKKVILLVTAMVAFDLARRGFDPNFLIVYYAYGGLLVTWWAVRLMRRHGSIFEGVS